VRRTVPPSAEIEERIERLLAVGMGENPRESLSELAKLGARLIIQRAVEDEFDAWLGRARYERRPDYQRGLLNYWTPSGSHWTPPVASYRTVAVCDVRSSGWRNITSQWPSRQRTVATSVSSIRST
jgi:hypothetical protein